MALLGCGEDEGVKQSSDAAYFPLRKGFYQVYDVQETNYINIDDSETFLYQLKTEVVDSFINQQGGYTYTIHRSKRTTGSDPWEFVNIWSVRLTTANVVVSEENTPFVKIAFPATTNRTWDGNALNSLPSDDYALVKIGKSYELASGETVNDYIQIVQEDEEDPIIFLNKQQEFYVRNIGLVKREITDVTYCTVEGQCIIGDRVIDHGTIYVQTLIDYGQN